MIPALNDDELRKKQLYRMTEGLGELGDYAKELKKSTKIGMWISIIFTLGIILLMGAAVGYQLTNGGFNSLVDTDMVVRRFNCTGSGYIDTVRNYEDADYFLKLYGGECRLYRVK